MKIKKRKLLAKNSVYKIFFDDLIIKDKTIKNYLVLDCISKNKHGCGGVIIIPKIKNKFLLLKYFNHIHNSYMYTFPGGFVDAGESTKKAACRELMEETGIKSNLRDLISLGVITPIPPLIKSKIHFFISNLEFNIKKFKIDTKEHDKIKPLLLNKKKVIQIFKKNVNVDSLAIACFFRYLVLYDKKF